MMSISSPVSLSQKLMRVTSRTSSVSHAPRGDERPRRDKSRNRLELVEWRAMSEQQQLKGGIQTRVFGPRAAETSAAGFAVPRETAQQLAKSFEEQLTRRQS